VSVNCGDATAASEGRPAASGRPFLLFAGPGAVPRLAEGVELLGEFRNSGDSQPPSLVRRADGQVIQMSRLLYLVASRIDGSGSTAAIAELVSEDLGRSLTAEQIRYLVTAKLLPLGVVANPDDSQAPPRANPLLLRDPRDVIIVFVLSVLSALFHELLLHLPQLNRALWRSSSVLSRRGGAVGALIAAGQARDEVGISGPAPEPTPDGSQSVPSAPRVPPNPNGETGATRVTDAAWWAAGRLLRYCSTTPPPMLQPTRCTGASPRASMTAARSSA